MSESSGPGQAKRSHGEFQAEQLLTPAEVAALFGVNAKTVSRWAKTGRLTAILTLGGHRRFRASEVYRFLADHNPTGNDGQAQT